MSSGRLFAVIAFALGVFSFVHAAFAWPLEAAIAFFAAGAIVAFLAEAVVVNLGWLEHHIGPKVVGVPLYVLFGWTVTIYVAFRVALLVADGWPAVVLAGLFSTAYDVFTDHRGVEDGYWTYTDDLPGPHYRGVPWWNFVGWFVISCLTATAAVPFL
ncbi:MAG: carotenoid biosynthesis protein [Halobacteriota archaeon]